MTRALTLAGWEWFKLRRRWMPWILLVILQLFFLLAVWGTWLSYQNLQTTGGQVVLRGDSGPARVINCADLQSGAAQLPEGSSPQVVAGLQAQCQQRAATQGLQSQALYDRFTLPGSITGALSTVQTFALILLAILTASVLGSEYGQGTLRTALVRGTGRITYIAGKLLMLAIAAFGALLVGVAVTTISSLVTAAITPGPASAGSSAASWGDAAVAFGKTWSSLLPYMAITAFFTLLARTSAVGIAVGLGYLLAEPILVALLTNFFSWFENVAEYLPMRNITAWAGAATGGFGEGDQPGAAQAFAVLVAYTVGLGAAAFWLIRKRDIAGASGS